MLCIKAVFGAGPKYHNRRNGGTLMEAGVERGEKVMFGITTHKSSGCLVNIGPHPTIDNMLMVSTKNGTEDKYIVACEETLKNQLDNGQLRRLYHLLKHMMWSVRAELVRRRIGGDRETHGTVPQIDHIVFHGGTTASQCPLTIIHLHWIHKIVGKQFYIPETRIYDFRKLERDGVEIMDRAYEKCNNDHLYPWLMRKGERTLHHWAVEHTRHYPWAVVHTKHYDGPGHGEGDAQRFYRGMNKMMESEGCKCVKHVRTHVTNEIDDHSIFEGFVCHAVTEKSMQKGQPFEEIENFTYTRNFEFNYIERVNIEKRIASFEDRPIRIARGWAYGHEGEKMEMRKSAAEALKLAMPKSQLAAFLESIIAFEKSDFRPVTHGEKSVVDIKIFQRKGDDCQLWIIEMKSGWCLYEAFISQLYPQGSYMPFPRLSRGMMLVVSTFHEENPEHVCDYIYQPNTAFKMKFWNYIMRTMYTRGKFDGSSSKKTDPKKADPKKADPNAKTALDNSHMDDLHKTVGKQMRRWRVLSEAPRRQTVYFVHLLQMFHTAFPSVKKRFNDVNEYVCKYVTAVRFKLRVKWSEDVEEMIEKYRLPEPHEHWKVKPEEVVNWFSTQSDLIEKDDQWYQDNSRMIWSIAVQALIDEIDQNRENTETMRATILYSNIRTNPLFLEHVRTKGGDQDRLERIKKSMSDEWKALGTALNAQKDKQTGLWKYTKGLKKLQVFAISAPQGIGKSTVLEEIKKRMIMKETSTMLVSSDVCADVHGKNGVENMIKYANENYKDEEAIIFDTCVMNFAAFGHKLGELLPCSHFINMHVWIPRSWNNTSFNNENNWYIPFSWSELNVMVASILLREGHKGKVEGKKGAYILCKSLSDNFRVPRGRSRIDAAEQLLPSCDTLYLKYYDWLEVENKTPDILSNVTEKCLGHALTNACGGHYIYSRNIDLSKKEISSKDDISELDKNLKEHTSKVEKLFEVTVNDELIAAAGKFLKNNRMPIDNVVFSMLAKGDFLNLNSISDPNILRHSMKYIPVCPIYKSLTLSDASVFALRKELGDHQYYYYDLRGLHVTTHFCGGKCDKTFLVDNTTYTITPTVMMCSPEARVALIQQQLREEDDNLSHITLFAAGSPATSVRDATDGESFQATCGKLSGKMVLHTLSPEMIMNFNE